MSLIQDGPIQGKAEYQEQPQAAITPPTMVEANEQNFMELIGQKSMQMPVILVFYSNSSPASQKMKTQLDKIIQEHQVGVQLAALNIETSPTLSSQLQIQSVPTVMAFFQGQPLDGFAGPQDDNFIRTFLSKVTGQDVQDPKEATKEAIEMGKKFLQDGESEKAVAIAQQILQAYPNLGAGLALLLRAYAKLEGADAVSAIVEQLSEEQLSDADVQSALKAIELSKNALEDSALEDLRKQYAANSSDLNLNYQLAEGLMANGENAEAINLLLVSFQQDRSFNEGAAKAKLLELFEALGAEDELTINGRKKLATLLF
ncbi:MAG: tetratricopeptide repeat protein [Alphaproteobacteria bacterium]